MRWVLLSIFTVVCLIGFAMCPIDHASSGAFGQLVWFVGTFLLWFYAAVCANEWTEMERSRLSWKRDCEIWQRSAADMKADRDAALARLAAVRKAMEESR